MPPIVFVPSIVPFLPLLLPSASHPAVPLTNHRDQCAVLRLLPPYRWLLDAHNEYYLPPSLKRGKAPAALSPVDGDRLANQTSEYRSHQSIFVHPETHRNALSAYPDSTSRLLYVPLTLLSPLLEWSG